MKPEEFVRAVKAAVVEENVGLYAELLRSTDRGVVRDDYWKNVLALYDSLDDRGKAVLLMIMRQVAVDSVSNVFGILDGSSSSSIGREVLSLLDGANNKLNGNLQDLFLASEES